MTSEETTLRRKGKRLWIPKVNPVFPDRCVMTGRTDDLIQIEGDLRKLTNPGLVKILRAGVVTGALAAGTLVRVPLSDDTGEASTVQFAVHEPAYREWVQDHDSRKSWIRIFVGLGLFLIFGGILASIFLVPVSQTLAQVLGMGSLLLGVVMSAAGGVVAVVKGQPLLHSVFVHPNHLSVKGAGPEFLDSLEEA